jgi:hypothetical protein
MQINTKKKKFPPHGFNPYADLPILNPPTVHENFSQLPIYKRIIESIRYIILLLEYKISPQGNLRYWFKLNLVICLLIAVPSIVILPLFGLSEVILVRFLGLSDKVIAASNAIFITLLPYLIFGTIVLIILFIIKTKGK